LCRDHHVDATVLVQAAPTVAETRYLLALAQRSRGLVRGVVGWVDLAAAQAVATLTDLARDPSLKSIRPMLQDIADPNWILRPDVQPALTALPGLGLRFDALVTPAQLPALLQMVAHHPDLQVVVDHGAKPAIATGRWSPWAEQMRVLAGHPNVWCKLSGLATEAGPGWTTDHVRRYADHLFTCFGAERVLWGSDWPVVELGGGYLRWRTATSELIAGLAPVEQAAVMGGNARRFYAL
jgi:L-fuconolactonase